MRKPGRQEEAEKHFISLAEYGQQNLNKKITIDFFAVSLPDMSVFDNDLDRQNTVLCHYLIGLGYIGLNFSEEAQGAFERALEPDPAHQGVLHTVN